MFPKFDFKDVFQQNLTTNKEKIMAKSTFTARISNCTMSIALDVRHPKGETYPVCVRYCINTKRMYHPIGDYCTSEDFTAIMNTEFIQHRSAVQVTTCSFLTILQVIAVGFRSRLTIYSIHEITNRYGNWFMLKHTICIVTDSSTGLHVARQQS